MIFCNVMDLNQKEGAGEGGYPLVFDNSIYGVITTSLKSVVIHGRPMDRNSGECNTVPHLGG